MFMKIQDDEATAYSSWNESDDISSYIDKDEVVEEIQSDDGVWSTQELHKKILSERAAMLMQRERSVNYCDGIYCSDGSDELSRISLGSNSAAANNDQDRSSIETADDPIDLQCRFKMLEWSISVVEFSYPPPSQSGPVLASKRKHSVETIRIISAAFSYIDRVMALSCSTRDEKKIKLRIQTRKEYKLLCMISLHIAAKMSGLFNRGDEHYPVDESRLILKKTEMRPSSSSATSVCNASTTSMPVKLIAEDCNTSYANTDATPDSLHIDQPRPLLHLISFEVLHSLCQEEFSIQEMCKMELSILTALEWRLNGGLLLEWLGLILEILVYCQSYGMTRLRFDLDELKESALLQLESIIICPRPATMAPSISVLVAVACAMEPIAQKFCYDGDVLHSVQSCVQDFGVSCNIEEMEDAMATMKSQSKDAIP